MLSYEAGRVSKARYLQNSAVLQTIHAVYDDLGHVKEMRTEKSDGSIIARSTYAHDKNGNITDEWKEDGSHISYVYGSLNELQQVTYIPIAGEKKTVSYQYDLFGNRETEEIVVGDPETGTTTITYTYDPVSNRLVTINGQAAQTDEVGNVTQDDRYGYHYNGLGQLTSVTSGAQTARFEYSLDGLRTKKIAIDGSTEYYYYNGGELAYVTNQDDNIKYYFVRSGSGALLYFIDFRTNTLGDVYTYLRNAHGDIIGLVDAAGEVGRYEYDAWGNATGTYYAGTDETKESKVLEVLNANPFRYAGYYYDTDTGLYYLKARYYDPTTGRFLSKDPAPAIVSEPMDANKYVYSLNSPPNLFDSDGLKAAPRIVMGPRYSWIEFKEDLRALLGRNATLRARLNALQNIATNRGKFAPVVLVSWFGGSPNLGTNAASLIKQVSDAVSIAAAKIADYTVKSYHMMSGSGGRNKFATDSMRQVRMWLEQALKSPNAHYLPNQNSTDSFQVFVDMGLVIGARGERIIKIVVTEAGRIITAYPVRGLPWR